MAVKVVGYWDAWFQSRENEYDVCWRFMLKHFGVDQIIMLPRLGIRENLPLDYTDTDMIEMNTIHEALAANPELTPIMVDERATTPIQEFQHPENVLYIFGRTGKNPMDEFTPWTGQSVVIPGVPQYMGDPLLHPHQACSIILYDRMNKLWH